jgi:hypothetical protein
MKAPIAQHCPLPGNAPDCTIGAFIGLHGQNAFKITRIATGVSFGPSALFALFFANNGIFLEARSAAKWAVLGRPAVLFTTPAICAKKMGFMRNFAIFLTNKNITPKISKNGRKMVAISRRNETKTSVVKTKIALSPMYHLTVTGNFDLDMILKIEF